MKYCAILFVLFLAVINLNCRNDDPVSNNIDNIKPDQGRLMLSSNLSGLGFGCMPTCWEPSLVVTYGPNSPRGGFRSLILDSTHSEAYYSNARNAGYCPIIFSLNRTLIKKSDWASVQRWINIAVSRGVNWFYIDDGLSDYRDTALVWYREITKEQIDHVARLVHEKGKLLATSEYFLDRMLINKDWFQDTDIIMPYQYIYPNGWIVWDYEMREFFQTIKDNFPDKKLVPFLAYKADCKDKDGYLYTITQKGLAGGGAPYTGYIEAAKEFTTENLIFYYYDYRQTQSVVTELISYLQTYYQMGP